MRAAFLTLAIAVSPVLAEARDGYECTIKSGRTVSDEGSFKDGGYPSLFVGKSFTVDRQTGRMLGVLQNHNGQFGQPQVVDRGGPEQSYKAVTIYAPNAAVDLLQVQQFAESREKPFLFVSSANVYAGTCVEY